MKKYFLVLIAVIFLYTSLLSGQLAYSEADIHARKLMYKGTNVTELTNLLTGRFNSNEEKARAIYTWIAENISYDVKNNLQTKSIQNTSKNKEEKEKISSKIIDDAIIITLKKRKGVSTDYSNLFASMCRIAGVKTITVEGASRMNHNLIGKVPAKNDYLWNAVLIENKWYVVDITMGAGIVDPESKKFIKQFRSEYFMIDPSVAIMTHYPRQEGYQFLNKLIKKEEFKTLPLLGYGFLKYSVSEYLPKEGFIKSSGNKTQIIKIRFNGNSPEKFILLDGIKQTEIKGFKSDDGFIYLGIDLKGMINRIITVAGVSSGETYEIITYKIV